MLKNKEKFLFILEMILGAIVLFLIYSIHDKIHGITEYIIFFIPYLILGREVFKNAAIDFIKGKFMRESFLMSVATIGAIILHEFPEALAVLMFYRVGDYFEDMAVNKTFNTKNNSWHLITITCQDMDNSTFFKYIATSDAVPPCAP